MTARIMMDLETLATSSHALILSIGAVEFAPCQKGMPELGREFYTAIKIEGQQENFHREVMEKTVVWWSQQGKEAQDAVFADKKAKSLEQALTSFREYVWSCRDGGDLEMWGNGADFDCVILGNAYLAVGLDRPWSYGGNRCYRTLKSIAPPLMAGQGFERAGTHHNALDDAKYQALFASRWLGTMGVK